jgi:hypothetical protein
MFNRNSFLVLGAATLLSATALVPNTASARGFGGGGFHGGGGGFHSFGGGGFAGRSFAAPRTSFAPRPAASSFASHAMPHSFANRSFANHSVANHSVAPRSVSHAPSGASSFHSFGNRFASTNAPSHMAAPTHMASNTPGGNTASTFHNGPLAGLSRSPGSQSGFGNHNQSAGFGNQPNQGGSQVREAAPRANNQGGIGNQPNQGGFGGNQSNQGGFGGNQSNQGGFGGNQANQGGFGGNQANQGGFGNQTNQGGTGSQGGSSGSQPPPQQ